MNDQAYAYLKRQVASLLDIDLDAYKSRQMRRRLDAFVGARAPDDPIPFLRLLGRNDAVLTELRNMLTINVSEFFRDGQQFGQLERTVLPGLLRERSRLKIWSAGCSNGHEPYSVAMILESLTALHRSTIVGTDIDRMVLQKARAGGPYPATELRNVSRERLEQHFAASRDEYTVKPDLVRRVKFSELNLLTDRFTPGWDLVICRNVMIYFAPETKAELVRRFLDALNPGGVLFIGATEALLGDEGKGFERLGGNFYRKIGQAESRRGTVGRAA